MPLSESEDEGCQDEEDDQPDVADLENSMEAISELWSEVPGADRKALHGVTARCVGLPVKPKFLSPLCKRCFA